MEIEKLKNFGISEEYIAKFKKEGIKKLYPYQGKILKKNLLEKNFILSVPTAAGKTFVAALAAVKKLERGEKVIYVVPLVALAFEKYEYFKKLFEKYKVAISIGDYDSADPFLAEYDLIICTTEKLDSLVRHGAKWIEDIKLIIIDEIHLLNNYSRGPTLEILIAILKKIVPKAQIIALSATIKNCEELAEWLNANLIKSNFRPVKLYEGVAYPFKIKFFEKEGYEISDLFELDASIVDNTLRLKKQALIFVSTRRKAQSLAKKLSKTVKNWLSKSDANLLKKLSNEIENILEVPTKQCKELAACIKNGVAFHHAGLLPKQKRLIEENFRKNLIKVIVATPTLAYGVNMPAFRVLIRDAKRYYPGIGSVYIPILEYKQFVGRAGRPTWDKFGESILIAKNEEDAFDLAERFIFGELEEIKSKLGYEPLLRMHILALIACEFAKNRESLVDFFKKTFFYFQYGSLSYIEDKISEILKDLKNWEFVKTKNNKLIATRLGKRVSELYIDPLTAHNFIQGLKKAENKEIKEISFLQLISNSFEMKPLLNVSTGENSEIFEYILKNENYFLQKIPDEWDLEYDEFLKSVKTAKMFESWINEETEDEILTKFRVAPGELRSRLEVADWLLYSLHELALLLNKKQLLNKIKKLRARMKYGVKEELLKLVLLEGVGRIKARKLFNSGLKTYADLKKISLESLAKLIGEKTALKIKDQLTGKTLKKEIQQTLINR